jgi:outer membrane biosynthesis protein TonB
VSPTEASHTAVEAPPPEHVSTEPMLECDAAVRARYPLNRGLVNAATSKPVPPYPSSFGRGPKGGTVIVEVLVHRDGHVVCAHVVRADTHTDTYFIEAAPRAAMGWRFEENFGLERTPSAECNRTIITFRF